MRLVILVEPGGSRHILTYTNGGFAPAEQTPDAVAAFLASPEWSDAQTPRCVADVTLCTTPEVALRATHSVTPLGPDQDPFEPFFNTQLGSAHWKYVPLEQERVRGELAAAAADLPITEEQAQELVREKREAERDCDEDERPVARPKRNDYAFNKGLHEALAREGIPYTDYLRWRRDYRPKAKGSTRVRVYSVEPTAPGQTPFFLATDVMAPSDQRSAHSIWACAPIASLPADVQAERIAIMFAASPGFIPFRASYITEESEPLATFTNVHSLLGRFGLPNTIRVRDVSGFFDHRPHTEALVFEGGIVALLNEWRAMDPAHRAGRIKDLAHARIQANTAVLKKQLGEEKEWDGAYVEVAEAGEGDEEDGVPDSEGEGIDLDEEEEEDPDEDDEEEDSFVARDDSGVEEGQEDEESEADSDVSDEEESEWESD